MDKDMYINLKQHSYDAIPLENAVLKIKEKIVLDKISVMIDNYHKDFPNICSFLEYSLPLVS